MKRHWLRGLLLGVSMALLLSGGVALAQVIVIDVTPGGGCVECFTDPLNPICIGVASSGWQDNETISLAFCHDGACAACLGCLSALNGVFTDPMFACHPCPGVEPPTPRVPPASACDVDAQNSDHLGEWRYRLTGDTSGFFGEFSILVAEVCEEEFVPEPGTIMLLGSGLAGLAGYATLRWRGR